MSESGDDEPFWQATDGKSDMMRQLEFWGINGSVLEQVTSSRTPKVGVSRPFFAVAQESYFNYLERSWDEVRQHFLASTRLFCLRKCRRVCGAVVLD